MKSITRQQQINNFCKKYRSEIDQVIVSGSVKSHKRFMVIARKELDYSDKTVAVDIWSTIQRAYRKLYPQ